MVTLRIDRGNELHLVRWEPNDLMSRAEAFNSVCALYSGGVIQRHELPNIMTTLFKPDDVVRAGQKLLDDLQELGRA